MESHWSTSGAGNVFSFDRKKLENKLKLATLEVKFNYILVLIALFPLAKLTANEKYAFFFNFAVQKISERLFLRFPFLKFSDSLNCSNWKKLKKRLN